MSFELLRILSKYNGLYQCLMQIIIGTLISHFAQLDQLFGMPIVGEIPTG